ncbi:MAG: kce [Firmicutes bacterium]|nr:kce [Bacillota bacterium]
MKPLIINLAPTGMVPTRKDTPYVPLTPEEIIEDVCRCIPLGVSMVHLHARDEDGIPTHRKEVSARIIEGIRTVNSEVIIVVTTSGRNIPEFEKRSEVLELDGDCRPDMASLTLSSLNFPKQASVNSPVIIESLVEKMLEKGILPEFEVFDLGMVNYANYLIQKKNIPAPYYFNILLGNVASAQAKLFHLATIMSEFPPDSICSVAGIGNSQLVANCLGLVAADGVRTGLEDNLWMDDDRAVFSTNYGLVERVCRIARELNRPIATPRQVRDMLKCYR